ncbi:glycosyltransferase [Marivita sp. S6314]|uniref:glycosyltransferase n=1 Tax=Marivita sp. S6314 TaxID=2926406 RepID=UPI001FF46182|nr:glycosyltransferase [Marivita sp. S6314]MCK0149479.1 glycosyltransferase [Marivita sp. S6314]
MTTQKIVHLVDDTTAGGVMRMLDHLLGLPGLADAADQQVMRVNRTALSFGRIDADVIVSHLTLSWRGLPALVTLRAMHPSARILHIEHSYTRAFTALNVSAKRRFFAMLRVGYALFDQVIAVSHTQANWLQERRLVNTAALRVIQPEVDLTDFRALPAPTGTARVIGAVGRLDRQKGFDVLIKAFRDTKQMDARLLIFGDGEEKAALQALAGDDTRIEFRGHCTDPIAAFAEVDIVAIPSRWEAFGIVAREALAAQRTVLMADTDGLRDMSHGTVVNGLQIKSWITAMEDALGKQFSAPTPAEAVYDGMDYATKWKDVFFNDGTPAPSGAVASFVANHQRAAV